LTITRLFCASVGAKSIVYTHFNVALLLLFNKHLPHPFHLNLLVKIMSCFYLYLSACPLAIYLQPLPDNTSCKLSSGCLNVDCCMFVSDLNRSFSFSLHVDECNFQISASIEDLEIARKLSAFEFGTVLPYNLNKIILRKILHCLSYYLNLYNIIL
jgi:hypothetical protein